eukprot:5469114-Pleurochrysis_carterae.AAC.1
MGGIKVRCRVGNLPSRASYDMGCPASNKDSPVYPERLALNIILLSPSREIWTVPAVNITRYR